MGNNTFCTASFVEFLTALPLMPLPNPSIRNTVEAESTQCCNDKGFSGAKVPFTVSKVPMLPSYQQYTS